MADLYLVYKNENSTFGDFLSLLDYTDGITLYDWTQAAAGGGGPTVETLGLRIRSTSTDGVADVLQSIDQKILEAGYYFQGNDLNQVWLLSRLDDEYEYRQALVLNIQGAPGRSMMDRVFNKTNQLNAYSLAIERGPFWEDSDAGGKSIAVTQKPMHAFELGTTIGGNAPARIRQLTLSAWQDAYWSEVWLGFRTDRFGSRSSFDPEIPFTGGYARVDTSIVGTTAQCNFSGTETLAERVYLRMSNASGTEANYRGEFQVLLSAAVGSGMTVNLRLKHGFYTDDADNTWIAHDNRVQLTSTASQLLDMGVVRFPFTRGSGTNAFMGGHALCVDAELISGSGTLTMGTIILIPRSEGFLYLKAGAPTSGTDGTITSSDTAVMYTHPEGRIEGHFYNDGTPEKALELSTSNWSLPVGDSRVCWAANRTAANGGYVSTHDINLSFRYFQRWRTLKGAG